MNLLHNIFGGKPRHGILSFFMWIGMLIVLAMIAARMVPAAHASGKLIPEVVSFVPLAILPTLVVVVLAVFWRRRILAALATICFATLVVWHAGYLIPNFNLPRPVVSPTVSTEDNVVRVMTFNTLNGHANAAQVVATVREQGVEALALQEVTKSFIDGLEAAGISSVLPSHVFSKAGKWDNGGINCLYTAATMTDQNTDLLPMDLSSMSAGTITVNGKSIRLVSAHPNSPHKGGQNLWSKGLKTIASLGDYDHSYVIMGDFNSTWNHVLFRQLLGDTFVDAGERAGEGFHMTFPANSAIPPVIEIDHIVYPANDGIKASNLATVSISGSDHLALLATLVVE